MKHSITYFLLLCIAAIPLLKAQDTSLTNFEKQIESSSNYTLNTLKIENKLKSTKAPEKDLLNLKILLMNDYINSGRYDKANMFCHDEIIKAKKNNLPLHEAWFYLGLARSYYRLKQTDKCLQYNYECMALATRYNYTELLKRCNHNLGAYYFEKLYDVEKAEYYFLKAIEYGKQTEATAKNNLVNNYRLLATLYDYTGKLKKSDSLYNLALGLSEQFNDSLAISAVLIFKARLKMTEKKYDSAYALCNKALAYCLPKNNMEYIQTAFSMYEQIAEHSGNYKEAYLALLKVFSIEVDKNSSNLKKSIAESEARFKVAELKNKERLFELQSKQTRQNYIYLFAFLFVISIGFIIFFYQRKLDRNQQQLKLQNLSAVYEAGEKERTRIAQDLHDNMGAYATSILAQIDSVELSNEESKREKISALRSDAENIMSTLRETIWILKTKNIPVTQFFDLVRTYTDKHLIKNLGIEVSYTTLGDINKQLNPSVSLNLYRIVQEVIQNIVKHAKATKVELTLHASERVLLMFCDNGQGFNHQAPGRKSGLENMEYRANEINYHINIFSEEGKGTCITVEERV